jgi:hypothetical protein
VALAGRRRRHARPAAGDVVVPFALAVLGCAVVLAAIWWEARRTPAPHR